jgi:hypothetical protein
MEFFIVMQIKRRASLFHFVFFLPERLRRRSVEGNYRWTFVGRNLNFLPKETLLVLNPHQQLATTDKRKTLRILINFQ